MPVRQVQAQKFKGVICDKCGVEVTKKAVRRERMATSPWPPGQPCLVLQGRAQPHRLPPGHPLKDLERVLYFEAYAVTDPGTTPLKPGDPG